MSVSGLPDYLSEAAAAHRYQQAQRDATQNARMDLSVMPHVYEWGPKSFYLYDTANLISLYPVQHEGLRLATELNEEGKFKYSTVLWGFPKKSAKSSVIAMVADWMAVHRARSQIRFAANDRRQADSRVGHYLRESIKLGARLGYPGDYSGQLQSFRQATKILSTNYTIQYPNGTIIEMVPADPSGEAGGNDDMLVFSELWGWKTKAHQQLWSELTISPNRYGYAQRWIDTYAGFKDESVVLWNLYEQIVKPENRIHPEFEFYAYGNLFAAWVTRPHFPWQTREYYAQERENLEESEFERLHRNAWSSTTSQFAPEAWWEGCKRTLIWEGEGLPPPKDRHKYYPSRIRDEEIVIAIDAGTDSDCFAIWAGTKVFEVDPLTNTRVSKVVQRYIKIWYPEDYDGQFDFKEPKAEIERLCRENNVIQVCYDKWQLKHFVDELEEENLTWFDSFDQLSERDVADKLLYDRLRTRAFIHWGEEEQTKHFKNSAKKVDGKRLRIVKNERGNPIDAMVATSMGTKRVVDLIPDL